MVMSTAALPLTDVNDVDGSVAKVALPVMCVLAGSAKPLARSPANVTENGAAPAELSACTTMPGVRLEPGSSANIIPASYDVRRAMPDLAPFRLAVCMAAAFAGRFEGCAPIVPSSPPPPHAQRNNSSSSAPALADRTMTLSRRRAEIRLRCEGDESNCQPPERPPGSSRWSANALRHRVGCGFAGGGFAGLDAGCFGGGATLTSAVSFGGVTAPD